MGKGTAGPVGRPAQNEVQIRKGGWGIAQRCPGYAAGSRGRAYPNSGKRRSGARGTASYNGISSRFGTRHGAGCAERVNAVVPEGGEHR